MYMICSLYYTRKVSSFSVFCCIFKPNFKHDSKCRYSVVWLHLWQAALTESEKFAETAESEVIFVFVLGGLELSACRSLMC